jgi:lipopolysaccharide/colanic/teichoic acid biosynthesis glycosyltransferase
LGAAGSFLMPQENSPFLPAHTPVRLTELLLISIGFGVSPLIYKFLFPVNYDRFTPEELVGGFAVSVIALWAGIRLSEGTGPQEMWACLFQQFCMGVGFNLVAAALINYFGLLTRSFFLIVVGGMIAAILLAIARLWIFPRAEKPAKGVLIVGFDPMADQLTRSLGQPVLGKIGPGEIDQFEDLVAERDPSYILFASPDAASSIPVSVLLKHRLRGVAVSDVPTLYETIYERVYCRGLDPAEILLSPALCPESRTMAIQAIYTNLVGLFFLVALSPVLILTALAVALFSGPGPVLESVECSGFHKIVFRLLRFRTMKTDGSGEPTKAGRVISRLHLANLPRLLNVVRGEMALFGPRPVRTEFARFLTVLLPFYSIRFSVKPGILGWNHRQWQSGADPASELKEIESDIYYVKQASPRFDLEILMRFLSGGRSVELPAEEFAGVAR